MRAKLVPYFRAGFSCLNIITHEEARAVGELRVAAEDIGYKLWSWSLTTGLVDTEGTRLDKTHDPLKALDMFFAYENEAKDNGGPEPEFEAVGTHIKNKSIVILKDFHMMLKGSPPILVRRLRDCIEVGRATNRHLVIIGCQLQLPAELEKEVTVIEFTLPTREELLEQAKGIVVSAKQELNGDTDGILNAGSGLTTLEFADAAAYSIVQCGKLDPTIIANIKADTIKKAGILEVITPGVTFADVGGLEELKDWVTKRKSAFTKKAREFGLPMPKGICLCGVQGAGKSFATRAIAAELGGPLIRLDAGKLFGGIVGSSEANTRAVISQVEAFGQCSLWVDEIDKGFAGMVGGHDGDNGVTRRVIGTFLTWMQEKRSPVFIIATANDLTKLPAELLRKGRWDELFFVDLPTIEERVAIWEVQIRRHHREPEGYNLNLLAKATDGWTGAEIESLFVEGMYSAFAVGDERPTTESLLTLSTETYPLSKTMEQQIKSLREWFKGKGRPASKATQMTVTTMKRKIA